MGISTHSLVRVSTLGAVGRGFPPYQRHNVSFRFKAIISRAVSLV